jgi:hypothetical protein
MGDDAMGLSGSFVEVCLYAWRPGTDPFIEAGEVETRA